MSTFDAQYKDDIQARMVGELEKLDDKTSIEGSFGRDVINANSIEFTNAYAEMNLISEAAFADTSWGEYLTRRCAEFGIDRKEAQYASAELTITGSKGKTVPRGSLFDTLSGTVQFRTDAAAVIGDDGTVSVSATAQTVGTQGNVSAGAICHIPASIPGVTAVTNKEAAHDGYDEETDDALLSRFKVFMRTPSTSGNKYHYYNWAMECDGVGNCKVVPLWNGAGTVKVIIIDSNYQMASEELIEKVAAHIEEKRPIGATVTVSTLTPVSVTIDAEVSGTADTDALIKAVNAYIIKRNLTLSKLSAARVTSFLLTQSSVEDVGTVTINGAPQITIKEDELVDVKAVNIHVMAT